MFTITQGTHGTFLVLPNDALGKVILEKKEFEPHFFNTVKNIVKEGDTCLDCGANLGHHTVVLSKLAGPTGHIISIEPQRIIYQQLNGNVFINGLKNVTCLQIALGLRDSEKKINMDYVDYDENNINIGACKVGYGGDQVEQKKIDSIINENTHVKFIKFDIQGSEVSALEGAKNVINRCRPIMFVEAEDVWLKFFGQNTKTLFDKINSFNYIILRVDNDYPHDYIAVPKEKENDIPGITKDTGWPITRIV